MPTPRRWAVQTIARSAQSPGQTPQALCAALDGALALLGICWHATDPQTGIPGDQRRAGHPPGDFERSLEFEYARDDVLRFADLAQDRRKIGVLSHATRGRPASGRADRGGRPRL